MQGICSNTLAEQVRSINPDLEVVVADDLNQLTELVKQHSRQDDLVLAMGAGDINGLWGRLSG